MGFFEREGEWERFKRWKDCVWKALLEFGCGFNVPTIRIEFARLLDLFPENCILVRANPDFPWVPETAEIEIMSNSLKVLKEVRWTIRQQCFSLSCLIV